MSAVNYAIGLQSGTSKVKLSSYLANRFVAAISAQKIGHDDAPTARSIPARVKFSQFQSAVRGNSSLVAPQRKAAVREEHLSSHVSVRLEEESHSARNVFRAAEPRNRAT
jgi:hypothetical protein